MEEKEITVEEAQAVILKNQEEQLALQRQEAEKLEKPYQDFLNSEALAEVKAKLTQLRKDAIGVNEERFRQLNGVFMSLDLLK